MLGGGPQRRIRRHLTHQRGRTGRVGRVALGGRPIRALLRVARGGTWTDAAFGAQFFLTTPSWLGIKRKVKFVSK